MNRHGHRIGDKSTDECHHDHRRDEQSIRSPLNPVHPAQAPRSQGRIGKKAGQEEQHRVCREKIVRNGVGFTQSNYNANESNYGQTNSDHGRGNSENVNADILFRFLVICFAIHGVANQAN